eukprot:3921024-Pyramimonas_sp.AAC.1
MPSSDSGAWVKNAKASRGSWLRAIQEVTEAVVAKARRDLQASRWEKRLLNMMKSEGLPSARDLPQPVA